MDEMLYDDKLSGDITKDRYESKHADIIKQIEQSNDELLIANETSQEMHNKAISLIKLTQSAKDQYSNNDLSNEAKRTILTELFDSAVYRDSTLSVRYTEFVESIAKRSHESKRILKEANMVNRTNKKDPNNGGQSVEKAQIELLCPLWQGHEVSNFDLRFWRPIYYRCTMPL